MKHLILYSICLLISITTTIRVLAQSTNEDMVQRANKLAHDFIIVDGHVDLPYRLRVSNFRLEKEYLGIPIETDEGDFDFMRAKEGGLDAPFMSIYIPARYQEEGGAKELADSLITLVNGIASAHPDKFMVAFSPDDVQKAFENGTIALPMGMENGAPLEDDISRVQYFKDQGISYITLTHSKDNLICDSSYDTTYTWNGLSPFGEMVVQEMNRVGIMVDISHVSDSTFYDVLNLTKAPVIASHSSCRKYTPGFERNMNDDMILHLAKNEGVIQINFGTTFLDGAIQAVNDSLRSLLLKELSDLGLEAEDPAGEEYVKKFREKNPQLYADVQRVADHIDHVVSLVGVDHVGLGSDYDGVGDSLPTGLKDVGDYPNLIKELLQRGYSEEDIEKICSGNVLRVWNAVLAFSDSMK